MPTASQPCGANGVQWSPPREGSAMPTASASTTTSTEASDELEAGDEMRSPSAFAESTVAYIASPTAAATAVPEPVRSAT